MIFCRFFELITAQSIPRYVFETLQTTKPVGLKAFFQAYKYANILH